MLSFSLEYLLSERQWWEQRETHNKHATVADVLSPRRTRVKRVIEAGPAAEERPVSLTREEDRAYKLRAGIRPVERTHAHAKRSEYQNSYRAADEDQRESSRPILPRPPPRISTQEAPTAIMRPAGLPSVRHKAEQRGPAPAAPPSRPVDSVYRSTYKWAPPPSRTVAVDTEDLLPPSPEPVEEKIEVPVPYEAPMTTYDATFRPRAVLSVRRRCPPVWWRGGEEASHGSLPLTDTPAKLCRS
jgi:hypothetical protein